jgi:hypothetical protein
VSRRVALVAALWLVLGVEGLVAGAGVVAADLLVGPRPRLLLAASAALVALVPLAILAAGLPAAPAIGPGFALDHRLADAAAGAAVALLVVGAVRDVRHGREDEPSS